MRLLALLREWTEQARDPVDVTELAAACQLSASEVEAAWRYLRDHHLIDTFSIPLTARINAKGIDALDSATHSRSGEDSVRGYGRVDSQEALDRAREVTKELDRLHSFLPKLTDRELSAYSTKSLSIGTFLQSKGQTFGVLTEDILANAFKGEADRRRTGTTQREVHEVPERKRSRLEVASWIGGIAGAIIALVALIVEIRSKSGEGTETAIAKSIPCGELGKSASESSVQSEDVSLAFTNDSDDSVDVRWIDERAKVVPNSGSTIPTTMNWSVTTSISHVWLISSKTGACIGIISAGEAASIVKISNQGLTIRRAPALQSNQVASNPPPQNMH
jgi:hypothetical protein